MSPNSLEPWHRLPLVDNSPLLGSLRSLPQARNSSLATEQNDLRDIAESLLHLKSCLHSVEENVKITRRDFESLSRRSRDNGAALEQLMAEIKGVRENDGTSEKLTGLAQLDMLKKLDQLDNLKRLDAIDREFQKLAARASSAAAIDATMTANIAELLDETSRKVEGLVGEISRLLTARTSCDRVALEQELAPLKQLAHLERLEKLCVLDDAPAHLNAIAKKLDYLEELKKLDNLEGIVRRDQLENVQLALLEALSRIEAKAEEAAAAARAESQIKLDLLLQKLMAQETELCQYRSQFESLEDLGKRIASLNAEKDRLVALTSELKTELRSSVGRLEETEKRYTSLHNKMRDMMFSRYKGVLGSGALAVLDRNEAALQDKENAVVVRKRAQNRSVSMTNPP